MHNFGSSIGKEYSSGNYFKDEHRCAPDSKWKIADLSKVIFPAIKKYNLKISTIIDVGCGSGEATRLLAKAFENKGFTLTSVKGYDVSPHVKNISMDGIEFIYADFCESKEFVDLVTLIDVIEHVPKPIDFIRGIAERCNVIAFRIPLEYCLYNSLMNKYRIGLENPGHLLVLDLASALNIITFSGVRIVDYQISTSSMMEPSRRKSFLANIALPLRYSLGKINPWLLLKTFGSSVTILALTNSGLSLV